MSSRRSRLLKPPYPFVRNDASPQNSGLVGWWPCRNFAGKTLFDMSTGFRNGTLTNFAAPMTVASGWGKSIDGGPCLQFDGVDDYVTMTAPVTAYPVTMTCWCKLDALLSVESSAYVVMALAKTSGSDEFRIDFFRTGGVTYLRSVAEANSGAVEREWRSGVTVDSNWHHLCAIFINSSSQAFYYDGKITTGSYVTGGAGTPTPSGITNLNLGSQIFNTSSQYGPLNGRIDDARVYNRGLQANEIWHQFDPRSRWDLRWRPSRVYAFLGPSGTKRQSIGLDSPVISGQGSLVLRGAMS